MTHLWTRREALQRASTGFGMLALSGLMADPAYATIQVSEDKATIPHFRPRAKNVIFCFMSGGVSHIDSFDPKPRLQKEAGKPMPMKVERTVFNNNGNIFPSPFKFQKHGKSGIPVSNMFPEIAKCADELAVIRSMTSKVNEHAQANCFIHTGFPFIGHPSAGAWVSYGLGSENKNLPGFVVLQSGGAAIPHGGVGQYGNGYLPAHHQASIIRLDNQEPVKNILPRGKKSLQRARLDFIRKMDRGFADSINNQSQV